MCAGMRGAWGNVGERRLAELSASLLGAVECANSREPFEWKRMRVIARTGCVIVVIAKGAITRAIILMLAWA